jgi:hypothetical protein
VNITGDHCYINDNRTIWGDMVVSNCAYVDVQLGNGMIVKGEFWVLNKTGCTTEFWVLNKSGQTTEFWVGI